MFILVLIAICIWLGSPVAFFGFKAWKCGGEYVRARWPILAIYCAMPVAIEVAGRFGLYSPLSAIPLLLAPLIVLVLLLGGPKRTQPRGFDVTLTAPPQSN